MIDDLAARAVVVCREIVLRDRDTDGISKSLAEGAGRRLHTRRQSALRMTGSNATPLPKLFDLLQRQVVASEVEQTVEQHRAVASRQHKPVSIQPMWIGRIVPKESDPEHIRHRRSAHRQTRSEERRVGKECRSTWVP